MGEVIEDMTVIFNLRSPDIFQLSRTINKKEDTEKGCCYKTQIFDKLFFCNLHEGSFIQQGKVTRSFLFAIF